MAQRLFEWAELVARTVGEGKPVTRDLEIWALRLNDIGIVAVSMDASVKTSDGVVTAKALLASRNGRWVVTRFELTDSKAR